MASDEVRRIKDKIVASRARLLVAVEGLDEAAWNWSPADGRWSVRLTLAHVGAAQWSHLTVARRLCAGQPVEIPGFDLDAWNAAAVAERADWTVDQVRADLEAAQRATLAFLHSLDEGALSITGRHPALGEVSVEQVLRVVALHDSLHRRDVETLIRAQGEERNA